MLLFILFDGLLAGFVDNASVRSHLLFPSKIVVEQCILLYLLTAHRFISITLDCT